MADWPYLSFLVNRVPPEEIAGALARRAARRAKQVLNRLQSPPTEPEILEAFGAEHLGHFARALSISGARGHWSDASHAASVRALAERLPGFRERTLGRAALVHAGRAMVFGRAVPLLKSEDVWLCDPVTGDRFAGPGEPPFLPRPAAGDPKRVWTLSRMEWAVALAQAAWLEPQDPAHVTRFAELANSLIRAAPPGEGIHAASAMEVSLRSMNFALALSMLRGHPALEPRFLMRAMRWLEGNARFTVGHLEDAGIVSNNHLVAGLVGLLHVAVLFPELPGAPQWKLTALHGLQRELPRQVLADGMGFEGSTGYHRLLLELGLLAVLAARSAGASLANELAPLLSKMLLATRAYVHGERAPQIGDCDSGRAIPLRDRGPADHGYLPALGAAILGDARVLPPGADFPDEAAWLLGDPGFHAFAALRPTLIAGSSVLPDFGLATLRRGPLTLSLRAGPHGQRGIGGHGHNDALAIELSCGNLPLVVDPGTYSYLGQPEARDRFRGTAMHSTVQLDGLEQTAISRHRPFALPDTAQAKLVHIERGADRERAAGEHRGYSPCVHRRRVWLERDVAAACVMDDFDGQGAHTLVSRFHFGVPGARVRTVHEAERARLACTDLAAEWDLSNAIELGPVDSPLAVLTFARGCTAKLVRCAHSPGYDELRDATCLELTWSGELPARLAAAILVFSPGAGSAPNL